MIGASARLSCLCTPVETGTSPYGTPCERFAAVLPIGAVEADAASGADEETYLVL